MEFGLDPQLAYSVLAISTVVLLLTVTLGVVYLTLIDWKDRRNKSREVLDNLPRIRKFDSQSKNSKQKSGRKRK